jgi:hypothetical protein
MGADMLGISALLDGAGLGFRLHTRASAKRPGPTSRTGPF